MSKQLKIGAAIVGVAALVALVAVSKTGFLGKPVDAALAAELKTTYNSIPTDAGKANFMTQSENLTKAVDPTLADLDKQIISCSPNVDNLMGNSPITGGSCTAGPTALATTSGMTLGGQCCGAMKDLDEYNKELEGLQKYKDISDVPMNPFKTPVATAKKWIDYDNATTLTPQEQAVFDQAMAMSKEKPCCCKCWHYFVNEGIAKKMIRDYHYTGEQVAAYWDTSGICGT